MFQQLGETATTWAEAMLVLTKEMVFFKVFNNFGAENTLKYFN